MWEENTPAVEQVFYKLKTDIQSYEIDQTENKKKVIEDMNENELDVKKEDYQKKGLESAIVWKNNIPDVDNVYYKLKAEIQQYDIDQTKNSQKFSDDINQNKLDKKNDDQDKREDESNIIWEEIPPTFEVFHCNIESDWLGNLL